MKKFSSEKQEFFKFTICKILEMHNEIMRSDSAYKPEEFECQEVFFNRLMTFDNKPSSYKKAAVSKIKKQGFPDSFFNTFDRNRNRVNKFVDNVINILESEFSSESLDELANSIEEEARNNKRTGKLKELKTVNQLGSYKYISNAIRKSLEYVIEESPVDYTLVSERPRSISGFVGRTVELKKIEQCLADEQYVVLSGMGGVGKTVLAREYLAEHKSEYDIIKTVTFDTNMDTTIASIECRGLPDGMKVKERCKEIIKLLNKAEEKAILLIDNFLDKGKECINDRNYLNQLIRRLKCKVIITTRMESSSAIKIAEMDDEDLGTLFLNQLQNRTEHVELFMSKMNELLDVLHHHTLLAELSGKVFDKLDISPEKFIAIMQGEDPQYPKNSVESSKDNTDTRRSISAHLDTLFSLAGLDEYKVRILLDFSLLPSDKMISTHIAARWFSPYCEDDFEAMNILGWLQYSYDEDERFNTVGLHPLIAETIRRQNVFGHCGFERELRNIESFAYCYFTESSGNLDSTLCSAVTKVKVDSEVLRVCKSHVCIWLVYNGKSELAYKIYQNSDDKLSFLSETYGWLSEFSDYDPELKQIIECKRRENEEKIEILTKKIGDPFKDFNKEAYEIAVSDDPGTKLEYDNIFIRTRLATADHIFSELKYKFTDECQNRLRSMIYSYHSIQEFFSLPGDIDSVTYLKFLRDQIEVTDIHDTRFYKTVFEAVGESGRAKEVSFYNDIYALRDLLICAAHIEYIKEIRSCIKKYRQHQSDTSKEKASLLISEWNAFLTTYCSEIDRSKRIQWDIHLAYCYCDMAEFDECTRILNQYKMIEIKDMPRAYIELKILEYYMSSCIKICDYTSGTITEYPSTIMEMLLKKSDNIISFIDSQTKTLKALNTSKLNLYLTAMRAVSYVFYHLSNVIRDFSISSDLRNNSKMLLCFIDVRDDIIGKELSDYNDVAYVSKYYGCFRLILDCMKAKGM